MSDVTSEWTDDPVLGEAEILGLYPPEVAAIAARATASDQGSGPTRIDD